MGLRAADVAKVAELARLELTGEELEALTVDLTKIVAFVEQLAAVDTDGVEEFTHPLEMEAKTRADELRPGLPRERALENAPEHDGECFLVPPVFS